MALGIDQRYSYNGTLENMTHLINANDVNGTITFQINGSNFARISGSIDQFFEVNKRLVMQQGVVNTPFNLSTATLTPTIDNFVISVTAIPGGGTTVSLPANMDEGTQFMVVDSNGLVGEDNIVIDTAGSETINGANSQTISVAYGYARFIYLGGDYVMLDNRLT